MTVFPSAGAYAGFEFIPAPASQRAASPAPAEPSNTAMTPAPAGMVVSEALSDAMMQRAPQSLVPPAQPVTRTSPSLSIDMNPLSRGSHSPAESGLSAALAQAMMNESGMNVSRAVSGGMAVSPSQADTLLSAPRLSVSAQTPMPGLAAYGAGSQSPTASYLPSWPGAGGAFEEAIGFGRDLPLPLAVSQIVPPDYAFNFEGNINAGDTVSWEGGKPWNIVLNDALAEIGASAQINEASKEITIHAGASRSAVNENIPAPPPRAPFLAQQAAAMTPAPHNATAIVVPLMERHVAEVSATPPTLVGMSGAGVTLSGLNNAAVMDPDAVNLWEAGRGATLRSILTDWSARAGVELFWSSDYDFPVESLIRIKGTFEEAVQTLLNGLRDAQPRPIGRLHPNLPEGPSVLVIETKHILE